MADTVWLVIVDGGVEIVCATFELAQEYTYAIDPYAEILEVAYKGE